MMLQWLRDILLVAAFFLGAVGIILFCIGRAIAAFTEVKQRNRYL